MPILKQNKDGIELPEVSVKKQGRALGGANKNPVKGVYEVEDLSNRNTSSPPLMIKAETRNAGKEFSELLAGSFIGKVVAQKDFQHKDNFVLTHPGVISYPEIPNKPDQRVMVQTFNEGAERLLDKRRGVEELRPDLNNMQSGTEKSRQLASGLDKEAFAATIVMSVLIADYSVHLDNFMKVDNNKPLRVDFGSSCKNILRPQNNKNVYASPPDTKLYKKYMEIWTDDPQMKAIITDFVWKNKGLFSPEKMGEMMEKACAETLAAAYKDAPLQDLLKIYKHLHGEDHPKLKENEQLKNDYNELKTLNKEKNRLIKIQEEFKENNKNSIVNMVKKIIHPSENSAIKVQQKLIVIEQQIASKSAAFNNHDGADELKKEIKAGIVTDMKKTMVKRAQVVVQEALELGHDERLAQIKEKNPIVAREIIQTEELISKEKEVIANCKTYGQPAAAEFRTILNELGVKGSDTKPTTNELYIEITQGEGKSRYYTLEIIKSTNPSTGEIYKITHMENKKILENNFEFLAKTQQEYREASKNLHNLEEKLAVLYTGLNEAPVAKQNADLPPLIPHTTALSPAQPAVALSPIPVTATLPASPEPNTSTPDNRV